MGNREATTEIARQSPEAAGILVDYLQASREQCDAIMDRRIAFLEAEVEKWRNRAVRAEERIWLAQERFMRLFDIDEG